MIGKPEWFTYRVAGWGLRPRTKEGWLYSLFAILLFSGVFMLPFDDATRTGLLLLVGTIIAVDSLHIMTQLPRVHDERENYQQLLIERNSSFAGVAAAVLVLFAEFISPGMLSITLQNGKVVSAAALLILLGMAIAKFASSVYVRGKT